MQPDPTSPRTLPRPPASRRRVIGWGAAALAGLATPGTRAQDKTYPVRPIRFVVPFAASAGADILARVYAKALADVAGQPVVVENRGGANGIVAVKAVLAAPADGYTVFFASNSALITNAAVVRNLPYDPVQDFAPVSILDGGFCVLVVPGVQQMVKVDLRTVVLEVPTQDVISRDNVSVKVSAVVYLRVFDAERAIIQVQNYLNATSQLSQTTLRSVLGKHELDDMLAGREKLNLDIQQALDTQTASWGIKVSNVEIKAVDLTESMIRAIARQAEAERERRAKVIHAEGELQASEKLQQAAAVLAREPQAIQLRYLETLTVIGADKNTTIVFPLPMDLLGAVLPGVVRAAAASR